MVPQYSPDGKKIAFSSDRSGNFEIWVCESSGLNSQQLTFFGGPDTGSPRWSPDGKQIVFDSHPDGPSDVYVINSEGGKPHRLTENPFDDFVPSWSRDGKWIYFASNRTGDYQVWKMPAGGGEAVQVTRKGGLAAIESPDGKSLYYGKDLEFPTSLWKVPLDGGQEIEILDPLSNPWNFAVAKEGIYFLPTSEATGGVPVEFFSFATGEIKTVATVGKAVWVGLAVSPDGRTILYTQIDQQGSDLMLVENFH